MNDPLYREIILEHWKNPQNAGVLKSPDIDVKDVNLLCGDNIHITATIHDGTIKDIRFAGDGCAVSQAAASILTEYVKGISVAKVKELTPEAFLEELGIQLTPARLKCALLSYTTLQKGVRGL